MAEHKEVSLASGDLVACRSSGHAHLTVTTCLSFARAFKLSTSPPSFYFLPSLYKMNRRVGMEGSLGIGGGLVSKKSQKKWGLMK
jgi:hypothetical protein